jgi:outer membrane lipoprotein carrier protein
MGEWAMLCFCALAINTLGADEFRPVQASRQGAIWQEFEVAHRGFTNFVANVAQTKTLKVFQQPIESEAKLWFTKPNLFRWEVVKPAPGTTLSDGKWLWMYYPEFQQAERYPVGDPRLGSGPMKAMTASMGDNPAALTNSCEVVVFESERAYRLEAVPRDPRERQFLAKLVLEFERRSCVLMRTEMESQNGDRTENWFLSTQINQPLDPALFRFVPPEGVKVISPFGK